MALQNTNDHIPSMHTTASLPVRENNSTVQDAIHLPHPIAEAPLPSVFFPAHCHAVFQRRPYTVLELLHAPTTISLPHTAHTTIETGRLATDSDCSSWVTQPPTFKLGVIEGRDRE